MHEFGNVVQVLHFLEFFVADNSRVVVSRRFSENLRLVVVDANVGVGLVVLVRGLHTNAQFAAVVILDKQGDGVFFLDALEHLVKVIAVHKEVEWLGGLEPKEVLAVQRKVN